MITDGLRLRQIVLNLIGNAVKFTEKGGIQVATEVVAAGGGQLVLRISVTDTGIGISEDKLARLFDSRNNFV